MKWIGQHIWDFVSRFRNHIYLEDVDTSAIASGKHLGLDANDKVVKSTIAIPPDLTVDGAGVIHANNLTAGGSLAIDITGVASSAVSARGVNGGTDQDVNITADGEVTVKLDSDNDEGDQKFKITNNADTEVASISETGHLYIIGDIGNTGSDNDLTINSDGNMTFIIDRDDDETGQSFSFKNFNVEIANLDESGNLQIDGDLTVSGGNITNAVTFDSGITDSGTIAAGTWNGTAIASAYLDADTAHLSTNQTFTGAKTFEKGIILDGDRNITPSGDGVTLHVDSQDITDTSTSASGTTGFFNHVVFENPRLMATNSSVTTTIGSTVYIKGAPVASTNQTITNAYALYIAGGDSYFAGDIIVAGNDIKDSGGNTIISSDGSGVVTMAGGNIAVGGSNANLNMNSGSDIVLEADNAGGGNTSTIQYLDAGGTNRIILGADSDVAILSNRAANGTVQIRANSSTAGGGGEVTVVTVENDKVTLSQNLIASGTIELGHASDTTIARSAAGTVTIEGNTVATTNKWIDTKTAGYWSSLTSSTGGYYITLGGASTNESTSLATSSYTAMFVAPYDGKILRISSFHQSSSSRDSTLEVYIDGDDSDLTNDQRGTDMSVSSYGQKFTQDCPADWTFSKGEAIAIKRTDTVAVYGTTMTVVFEYDLTT